MMGVFFFVFCLPLSPALDNNIIQSKYGYSLLPLLFCLEVQIIICYSCLCCIFGAHHVTTHSNLYHIINLTEHWQYTTKLALTAFCWLEQHCTHTAYRTKWLFLVSKYAWCRSHFRFYFYYDERHHDYFQFTVNRECQKLTSLCMLHNHLMCMCTDGCVQIESTTRTFR